MVHSKLSLGKIVRALYYRSAYVLFIPGFVIALFIRLIRPLVKVRFGLLAFDRIGNLYPFLWYLCKRDLGRQGKGVDVFYQTSHTDKVGNVFWQKLCMSKVKVFPHRKLAWAVFEMLRLLPGVKDHRLFFTEDIFNNASVQAFCDHHEPLFSFSDEEKACGEAGLRALGVLEGKPFICFHTRDSQYLKQTHPGCDWSYHDYRDTSIRNYCAAAEMYVRDKDCYALRMGAAVAEDLGKTSSKIIDYAMSGKRTDFMDVYLSAQCRFFVGTDCGMTIFPEVFRRPLIITNKVMIASMQMHAHNTIVIMKKWYFPREKRFLGLEEILKLLPGFHVQISARKFGVEFVDNTPEEIVDAIDEMESVIAGTWCESAEDARLQERFWSLFGKHRFRSPTLRIGQKFLRDNREVFSL